MIWVVPHHQVGHEIKRDLAKKSRQPRSLPEWVLLAFSGVLYGEEFVIAYNILQTETDEEHILGDPVLTRQGSKFGFLDGGKGHVSVFCNEEGSRHFIKLKLAAGHFVILSNDVSNGF